MNRTSLFAQSCLGIFCCLSLLVATTFSYAVEPIDIDDPNSDSIRCPDFESVNLWFGGQTTEEEDSSWNGDEEIIKDYGQAVMSECMADYMRATLPESVGGDGRLAEFNAEIERLTKECISRGCIISPPPRPRHEVGRCFQALCENHHISEKDDSSYIAQHFFWGNTAQSFVQENYPELAKTQHYLRHEDHSGGKTSYKQMLCTSAGRVRAWLRCVPEGFDNKKGGEEEVDNDTPKAAGAITEPTDAVTEPAESGEESNESPDK